MVIGRLGDLAIDAEEGVQGGHRVLQDHRDLGPAHVAHLALAHLREVLPGKVDAPADDLGPRRQEADDREARRGLAAAGFADDAERLAFLQREADPVDRLDDALAAKRDVMRLQIADLKQKSHTGARLAHRLRNCGSSRMRSQSPISCVARTTSMMQRPGKIVSHQSPTISIERPSASIEPQAGSGGGTPTPRNDSDASAMITTPIVRLASTMAEFKTFGRMWRRITRVREAPAISASLTNSRSRRLKTSPRITRA